MSDLFIDSTLYDRLSALGYPPHMLNTQYRCNPAISNICRSGKLILTSNYLMSFYSTLFYDDLLRNGITASERLSLVAGLPPVVSMQCRGDVSVVISFILMIELKNKIVLNVGKENWR